MHDRNCLATLVDEVLTSFKSMIKNRFMPMLIKDVSLSDFFFESKYKRDLVYKASAIIGPVIMGHVGGYKESFQDEDDVEDQEKDGCEKDCQETNGGEIGDREKVALEYRRKLDILEKNWCIRRGANVVKTNRELIEKLKVISLEDLRKEFLPVHFRTLVTDNTKEPGWKATMFPDKMFLILRFFNDVNKIALNHKHQLLFPSANPNSSFIQLTNTIAANTWVGYLNTILGKMIEKDKDWIQTLPGEFDYYHWKSLPVGSRANS